MPRINVLEKHVAELIAAGEVVERPCSVVKELVENSIDAGATNIIVEIQNGGNTLIRVSDNGCGIDKDDIRKAFLRHATSKISAETDLDRIHTFGFRGEALPSIAAVSKVEILTRTKRSNIGYCCNVSGSEFDDISEAGCPEGTTIVVKDLFYNTPARQKFLKKDITESNAVSLIMDKIALSHPEVKFKFIKDGETKLNTYGNGNLLSVISSVSGREFASSMLSVDYCNNSDSNYRVHGFISSPSATKASRNYQTFFVNMRYVKTNTAMAALEEAFKGSAMVGKFPGCVLFIDVPLDTVDVNVHPAKTEIRFQNEKLIFDLVYYGVKSALHEKDVSLISREYGNTQAEKPLTDKVINEPVKPFNTISADEYKKVFKASTESELTKNTVHSNVCTEYKDNNDFEKTPSKKSYYYYPNIDVTTDSNDDNVTSAFDSTNNSVLKEIIHSSENENDQITISDKQEKSLKYIGEAFKTYIILESENSIILVDKHAAHERILYEKLKKGIKAFDSQMLLKPITVSLSEEQCSALSENHEEVLKFGFDCDDFGKGTILVRSIPFWVNQNEISDIISEISDSLISMKHDITPEKLDGLYANMSCRAAIKANDNNTEDELMTIIDLLAENTDIKYCPHGRPVSTEITKTKLEHMFGRIQ